ncbi:hypothetical protein GLYMA_19G247451v4 [Glycine max]|nr:hypothetical protein GLYMA_19G247451v4 [Glycine max]
MVLFLLITTILLKHFSVVVEAYVFCCDKKQKGKGKIENQVDVTRGKSELKQLK